MYRERHSHERSSNNRSIMAKRVDEQIEEILTSVKLLLDWRDEIVRLVLANTEKPDIKGLKEKRKRLSRSYSDGVFSDTVSSCVSLRSDPGAKSADDQRQMIGSNLLMRHQVESLAITIQNLLYPDVRVVETSDATQRRPLGGIPQRVSPQEMYCCILALPHTTRFRYRRGRGYRAP